MTTIGIPGTLVHYTNLPISDPNCKYIITHVYQIYTSRALRAEIVHRDTVFHTVVHIQSQIQQQINFVSHNCRLNLYEYGEKARR